MIEAYTPLNNLEYTIYRPIIANIVKEFATKFLKNPNIFVEYTEDKDRFGDSMYDTNYATQYNKQRLVVDYEISQNDEYMLTNNLRYTDGLMLLRDEEIDYYIQSSPLTHDFTVNITIKDKFKNRLLRLLNSFKIGEINDTNYIILNADVFFTIPNNVLALTKNIADLKYGGNVTWDKYLEKYSLVSLDKLNSKSGDKYIPAYKIEYRDIAVWTEVGFLDKKIERDDNWFSLELTLKFSFDVITNLIVKYPILVCNKPINKEYLLISESLIKKYALPIERSLLDGNMITTVVNYININLRNDVKELMKNIDIDKYVKLINKSPELNQYGNSVEEIINNSLNAYIKDMYNLNYNIKRYSPIYDVWRYYIEYDKYEPMAIMLLKIDNKSYTYINLYELTNLGYSKEFIDYLIDNKANFLKLFKGLFHFNIYMGRTLIPMDELDIAEKDTYIKELDLQLKRGDIYNKAAVNNNLTNDNKLYINMLKYYHLVLYISNDPNIAKDDSDITLLLQYVAMKRLEDLKSIHGNLSMKTVMQFTLLAHNLGSKPPIINNLLKEIINK